MPTSSWDVLEKKLYDALVAVKVSTPLGNVHRHKPEHALGSELPNYFFSEIAGEPELRAWFVWVTGQADFETHQTTTMVLTAELRAFYAKGAGGAGAKLLKAHLSIVHQAFRALDRNLGGACTLIREWTRYDPAETRTVETTEGTIIEAGHTIICERINGVP